MRIDEYRDRLSEADLEQMIIDRARLLGWRVHHDRAALAAGGWKVPIEGDAGFPDLVLSRRGTTIFAELKTKRGRLNRTQCEWLAALSDTTPEDWRSGHLVASRLGPAIEIYVWRPDDWPTIQELLR